MFFVNFVGATMTLAAISLWLGPTSQPSRTVALIVLKGGGIFIAACIIRAILSRNRSPRS
jgi:hypothetical protein